MKTLLIKIKDFILNNIIKKIHWGWDGLYAGLFVLAYLHFLGLGGLCLIILAFFVVNKFFRKI